MQECKMITIAKITNHLGMSGWSGSGMLYGMGLVSCLGRRRGCRSPSYTIRSHPVKW